MREILAVIALFVILAVLIGVVALAVALFGFWFSVAGWLVFGLISTLVLGVLLKTE